MQLRREVIEKLSTIENRLKLALFLSITEQSVIKYLAANIEDGPLTRQYVKPYICELTGLTESELLEDKIIA